MDGKAHPPPKAQRHVITTTKAKEKGGVALFSPSSIVTHAEWLSPKACALMIHVVQFHVEIAYNRHLFHGAQYPWAMALSKVQPNPTPSLSFRIDFYRRPGLQGFRGRMCVQKLAIIALPLCRIPSTCSPFGHEQTNRPTSPTNCPSQHNTNQNKPKHRENY